MGGVGVAFLEQTNPLEKSFAGRKCLAARYAFHPDGSLDNIVDDRLVGPQVVTLEDHANAGSQIAQLPPGRLPLWVGEIEGIASIIEGPTVGRLENVHATQKRALARPACSDD